MERISGVGRRGGQLHAYSHKPIVSLAGVLKRRWNGWKRKNKTHQDDTRKEQDRHTSNVNSHVHLVYLISQILGMTVAQGGATIRGYCDKLHTAESQPLSHGNHHGRVRPGTHEEKLFLEVQRHVEVLAGGEEVEVDGRRRCWRDNVGEERR